MIEKQNKRPQMNDIWNMLAKTIDGCEYFSPNKSFRTKPNINSFESRFTREINDFLSSKFERPLLKDGKYKNWLFQNSQSAVIVAPNKSRGLGDVYKRQHFN